MEFVTLTDIEAPRDHVFQAMCDFSAFERQALRGGIDVIRTSGDGVVGIGLSWRMKFQFRNRPRTLDARITAFDPPSGYVVKGVGNGFDVQAGADMMSLSRSVTRLSIKVELIPRNIATRIIVQSLRLVRRRIQVALDARIAVLARDIEGRWRSTS